MTFFLEGVDWLACQLYPAETGRFLVRVVTLGHVHCEDDLAWWIGSAFWLTLPLVIVIGVAVMRRS